MMQRENIDHKPSLDNPLIIQMRYRCACANNEVISLSYVLEMETLDLVVAKNDEKFIWLMRRLLRDMQIEIEQHSNKGANA